VSSPGADRPFFKISQFEQFMGSNVTVNVFVAVDGRKRITGQIIAVEDEIISLKEGEKVFRVAFAAMSKARLVPEYVIGKGGQGGK
jgi:ribosome maturation factor RimP